ncbi:MAG: methyl-accepting chemotaxis protein [Terriglobales bacterium]
MKGRVARRIWVLIGINFVAMLAVLALAYGAGARSGGLTLRDFTALPEIAGFEFLTALFLIVALSLALLFVLGNTVLKPTADLVEFSEKLAAGTSDQRAEVRPDDFGVVADNCNRAAEALGKTAAIQAWREDLQRDFATFQAVIAQVVRGDMTARAGATDADFSSITESFNEMLEGIGRRLERVRASGVEISAFAGQVLTASTEMGNSAAQQDIAISGVNATVRELSENTRLSATQADAAANAARQALELAERGNKAVRESHEGMQRIRGAMQATAAKIQSLGDRSLQIYDIINIIHETNLLALSAVIEASRGGQAGGQTLDVLASELRKLADHSRGATKDIVSLLKSIQGESNEAVVVMEQANRVAESGAKLSEQGSQAFAGISQVLKQTAELAQTISASSREQVQTTDAIAAVIEQLASNTRTSATKGRQGAKLVEQIARSSEQLSQAVAPMRQPAIVPKSDKPEATAAVVGRA